MTHQRWHQLWSAAFRPLPQTMGEGRFAGLAGGCPMKRRERRAWRRSAGLQPALGKRTAGTVVRKPSLAPRNHGEKPVTKPAPHRPFMMSKSAGGDEALFSYRRLPSLPYRGFPNPQTVRQSDAPDSRTAPPIGKTAIQPVGKPAVIP